MENESIAEQAEAIKKQKSGALIAVCTGLGIVAVVSLAFNAYQFIYRADGEEKDVLIAKYAEKTGVSADSLRDAIRDEKADELFGESDKTEEEADETSEGEEAEKKDEASTDADSDRCVKNAELSSKYIYFPEYGLKLKKSKKLEHYAWRIDTSGDATNIYITAQPTGLDGAREYTDLDKFSSGFGAATIRNGNEVEDLEASIAFKDGETIVSYSGAQTYYDVDGTEEEQATVREEIMKMLANGFSRI